MSNFGYETIVSVLLPGTIVLAAALLFLQAIAPTSEIAIYVEMLMEKEFHFAVFVLLSSVLFGSLLGSMMDVFEYRYLDGKSADAIRIPIDQYREEWHVYIETLPEKRNSYIGKKAMNYNFELRSSVALFILAIAVLVTGMSWLFTGFLVGLAALMYGLSRQTHHLLAKWRHRLYEAQALQRLANRTDSTAG